MRRGISHSRSGPDLPHQLTSFIGREIELAELKRLLQERRLVTLTGAGGSGKTRLAVEAASALAEVFDGGVFLVELAPLSKPELVVETVARALGVEVAPDRPLLELLTHFLTARNSLLVLDNCEHLLDECARLVGTLLANCAELRVLATSREPLGIGGECLFRVPLLSLPGPSFLSDPARLAESEAVQLFMDRARLANPDFALVAGNAEAVAQVCIRLDGIPLALELAAASLRALPLSQIAARLDQRFRLLTSGDRTALPRQQTLKALLNWSYTLLTPAEQVVFHRLAVFPADWTLEAAEYICGGNFAAQGFAPGIAPEEVLGALIQLVNKSLVQLDATGGRYRMLETIHLYARTKLEEAGGEESVARRHLDWYLQFVEEGSKQESTSGQHDWFLSLHVEQDNIRAALSWAIAARLSEHAARLALAMRPFWVARAYHREGLRWLEQVLLLDSIAPISVRVKAGLLAALGYVAQEVKSFEQSRQYYTEALELWREQGDNEGVIASLLNLGWQGFLEADLDAARRYAEEILPLARTEGDLRSVGSALNLLATSRIAAGSLEGVVPALEECLSIWRRLGDLTEIASALTTYATAEHMLGDLERACSLFLEALYLQVSLGTYTGLLGPIVTMFQFARHSCKPPEKYIYLAHLDGVFNTLEEKVGGGRSPWAYLEQFPLHEQLRLELGEEAFTREVAAGEALSVEGIVALAEDIVRSVLSHNALVASTTHALATMTDQAYPAGLTAREVEVLRLVAAGLTNRQAAEQLSVTPRTINAHLTSIYSKIGVTSRAGAVRFAVDHGLV